ncbi:MAG: hypothetical protein EPN33_05095 [Acidobacteria bacterium]|nr:MAG: hypothetical protein EPN33_05095 [Acidobacteriota bacterium]
MASLSAPGVPAITYNPDTAGRIGSISASSGQNPVSSASYFPSQQVRTATFGSGDSDTYALDTNLRLSSYTLDINGSNDTGTLVWNGNNTLSRLPPPTPSPPVTPRPAPTPRMISAASPRPTAAANGRRPTPPTASAISPPPPAAAIRWWRTSTATTSSPA